METIKIKINDSILEVPKESITQGIEKGEVSITDESLLIDKKEDYEKRIKNIESTSYTKGKKDGVEIEWKETKRKLGLDIDGKNGDEILDAFRQQVLSEAKIEPNKKIQDLQKDFKTLQDNYTKLESEKNGLIDTYSKKEKELKTTTFLYSLIPDKATSETFTKNDIATLFKANGYEIDIVDNKEIVLLNGDPLKDEKTLEPKHPKSIVEKFVTDKGFMKNTGGREESDKGQGKVTAGTIEAFEKEMKDRGIKTNSPEYIAEMTKRVKDGTLKY